MADVKNELESMIQRLRDFIKSTDEAGASVARLKAALSGVGGGLSVARRAKGGLAGGEYLGIPSQASVAQMERDLAVYRRLVEKTTALGRLQVSAQRAIADARANRMIELRNWPAGASIGPSQGLTSAANEAIQNRQYLRNPGPYGMATAGARYLQNQQPARTAELKEGETAYNAQIRYEEQLIALVRRRTQERLQGLQREETAESAFARKMIADYERIRMVGMQAVNVWGANKWQGAQNWTTPAPNLYNQRGGVRGLDRDVQDIMNQPKPQTREQILSQYAPVVPGGTGGLDNLNKRLQELGVNAAHVTSVTKELSTGVTSMSLKMTDASGAIIQGSVHMDKFGNILTDTGRRFRSFADAITVNITKVIQWAVATSLVYATMRGLQSVMSEMIQTQSELANIQVALGGSTEQLNTIFEESARVADLTSSSTMGVLEGYALAYRAAGSIADENERLLVSNNLLAESMTLAKLAGIDQARAMDILVGALRQTGRELTEGRDLIDKWVYISRIANVSLETLAETYSIVGSSAEGVGISMEQLNALTATLAESTGLSASETGNAIRGIIAGFQSASAEQALGRFGIATRSATGELRDFYELYLEIAELTQSGILSERDISEIANAIGGGYRRGAQVQVLLENSNRTRQLEADQTYAGGAAAEALGIQMQTLESAITRLGNAFTKFAQTLGSEGGFASIITVLVNGLTEMLDLITAIATGMGKATPVILAYAAAWAFLNSTRGQAFLSTQNLPGLTGLAGKFGKLTDEQIISQRLAQVTGNTPRMGAGAAVGALGRRTGITAMGALGYGIAGINVAGAAAEGITSGEGLEKAGVAIVGSIIGGLIGSATIVGAPVGAAIGSMAATSLYEGIQTDSTKFRQLWADILAIPEPGKPGEEPPVDELASAVDQIGLIPKALAGIFSFIGNAAGVKPIGGQKLTPEVLLTGWATGETGRLPVPPEIAQAITEAINNQIQQAFEEGTEKGTLGIQAEGRIPELASSISGVVNDFMADQLNQLVLGEVSLEQLRGLTTEIDPTKIATQLSNVMGALDFTGMSRDTQELAKFMLELDDATRLYASTLGADVIRLQDAYNNALDTGTIEEQTKAQEALNDATARFKSVFPALELQRRVATVDRSQVFDVGKATPQQVQMAVSLAQQFQKAYFLALADGNEELAAIMEQQVEPILLKYGEGLGQRFGEKVAVGSQFMTEAFKELDIQTTMPKFGFQDLRKDLGMEDLPGLMRRYQKVVGSFQQNFPDYKLEETDVGLITKNGMQTVHADLSLLNLAMQDLIDVNEQQLEGVWNLPSGMTAFVAWSSLFSRNMPAGGTSTNFEDVFNKDRMDELAKATQPDQASIEQELTRLNEAIAAMERVLSLPAQQVGMQERLAMRGELETTKGKRDELTQQLQAMQLSQTLGIQQQPGTSVVDQLREALTVQSKIELNANIRLVVDGRTLANIVKQYLFEDLTSAANKSAGTGGGQYVVGH